eukprot:scaffold12559_cov125-Isochrysis_galbana.AAC.6
MEVEVGVERPYTSMVHRYWGHTRRGGTYEDYGTQSMSPDEPTKGGISILKDCESAAVEVEVHSVKCR